jgi:disulfide bond formation protein DsbB
MYFDFLNLSTINFACAIGGLALLALTIVLFFDYFFNQSKFHTKFVEMFAWQLVILVTIGGVAMSLVYSEYFGFIPCSLCWLQRIALYPQALFAVVAYQSSERVFFPLYSAWLSSFGFLAATYHYIDQMIPKKTDGTGFMLPCLADGTADCAEKIINEFGFVTFPLLSMITFAFLIVMYLNLRRGEVRG